MTHEEMIEWFSRQVCGKADRLTPDECHATHSGQGGVCSGFNHCRIREKSEEQLNYAKSPIDQNIFLKACPGSGKTEVVGLKAAYEIKNWSKDAGGIAVLTFTNNAAEVIHARVCQFAGIESTSYPHYIGTIDSWLHKYIGHPFGHVVMEFDAEDDRSIRLVDDNDTAEWLNAYKLRTSYYYLKKDRNGHIVVKNGKPVILSIPLYANMIRYAREYDMWEIRVPGKGHDEYVTDSQYYESDAFSAFRADKPWLTLECVRNGFRAAKSAFHTKGFATYRDVENVCVDILAQKPQLAERLARRFPLVIVDECQDLSWTEMSILRELQCRSTVLHFVGDLNQAIYDFKKVSPERVAVFTQENGFRDMALTGNFRSCQGIVDACQALIPAAGNVRGLCLPKLDHPCLFVTYNDDTLSSLPNWFERFLNETGFDVHKSAIVARGWSTVAKLGPSGNTAINNYQTRLAMGIHLWRTGGVQAMTDALRYMGRFILEKGFPRDRGNSREYYCPDSVTSAVRWRLFLARVLDCCISNTNIADLTPEWSAWAVHVRNHFGVIVRTCQPVLSACVAEPPQPFNDLDSKTFRAPQGGASQPVIATLDSGAMHRAVIRITTIHAVKGETMEAIMLVSAPSKQGTSDGYWIQWLEDPSSEAARLAYVASSRPQHLLVWAVPEQKNADYSRLEALGFAPYREDWPVASAGN
ncbi:MAG: UvrD-helicase domain-containing protein [Phycisphaerales bacterium]